LSEALSNVLITHQPVAGSDRKAGAIVLIDCDSCAVRDIACGDCVVTMLLERPSQSHAGIEFDEQERLAVELLAAGGLISPLRLVPVTDSHRLSTNKRYIA
jgi:hypothetical protein